MRMNYIIIILYIFFVGCFPVKREKEYVFRITDELIFGNDILSHKIDDIDDVTEIASVLKNYSDSINMEAYSNWFSYHRLGMEIPGYSSIIRISDDDYSERQFLLREDSTGKIISAIEVASRGGDGADHFSSYSVIKGDSIIKYNIIETYPLDPVADTFLSDIPVRDISVVRMLLPDRSK